MRVCGSATVLFRKLILPYLMPVVKSSQTVLARKLEGYRQIDARRECHSRIRRLFHWQLILPALHCIALASMLLIDMQHHSSGIMPSPGRNPLHGCLHPEEKPPKTNQSIVTRAAIGTVGLACLVQLIGPWCCGNRL